MGGCIFSDYVIKLSGALLIFYLIPSENYL